MSQWQRSFLKWAGGKSNALNFIFETVPTEGHTLIEPFVGSGCVALNTNYQKYILCDGNRDLINLYRAIQRSPSNVIRDASLYFSRDGNTKEKFLSLRRQFNFSTDEYERSILFLYLNRHCYNGLMRYNKGLGHFNTSFGRYKEPLLPEKQIHAFGEKFQSAEFVFSDFRDLNLNVDENTVIYCDPPYLPASKTANFVSYTDKGFEPKDHDDLNILCDTWASRSARVYVSNANVPLIAKHYERAKASWCADVRRSISSKAIERKAASEIILQY